MSIEPVLGTHGARVKRAAESQPTLNDRLLVDLAREGARSIADRLRDVQLAARHADPRTTTIYDRRQNLDRHAAYVVVAFVAFVASG